MYFLVFFYSCAIFIYAGSWPAVEASPAEQFLSVRGQKCSLAGESLDTPGRRGRRNNLDFLPEDMKAKLALMKVTPKLGSKQLSMIKKIAGPKHVGPKITPLEGYDPSTGYEPYWVGGGWTLQQNWTDPNATTTTPEVVNGTATLKDQYCGYDCNMIFRMFGPVCGRNSNGAYASYQNYCMMLAKDCKNEHGWIIAYRGVCTTIQTYNTLARQQHATHMQLVKNFYEKFGHPIGSGVSTTEKWTYISFFDDNGKRK